MENKVGTVRRNLFVPVPHYHDILEYNKELLQMHEEKAAELHYKKGIPIRELFAEDQKSFADLPSKAFNVCRYDYFKADGYGKVCIDGKHYYSTRPEYRGQKVMIGVRAHFIEVLDENGHLVVRHRRQYGSERTDVSDYSTTLEVLSRNAGSWSNSGVRNDMPDPLVEYLDGLEKQELKDKLRLLSSLNDMYGYHTSIEAMGMALKNGSVNASDATIIAQRINGHGLNTPPESLPAARAIRYVSIPLQNWY